MINWESELSDKLALNIISKSFTQADIDKGLHISSLLLAKHLLSAIITLNTNGKVLQELSLRGKKDKDIKNTDILYLVRLIGDTDLEKLLLDAKFVNEV
jgi:hypothetical protein